MDHATLSLDNMDARNPPRNDDHQKPPNVDTGERRVEKLSLEVDSRPPEFSDDELGLRFTKEYGNRLRYTAQWGRWHLWNGIYWQADETLRVFSLVRQICRAASEGCQNDGVARKVASSQTIAAVERLVRSDSVHRATVDQWDQHPWLLNTPGGTVDLETGHLRSHRPDDYLTKTTAVVPAGKCPLWFEFLIRITSGDRQLISFLQRMIGYTLTGITREHAVFFLYGTGANGKSVFVSTISGMLAEYARVAAMETFMASAVERHPTELAALQGARLVTAVETEDGRRWAEAKLKALTGGEKIAARMMRQDYFEYTPQFKLVIAGNHKPGLRNVDEAIKRRLYLVPLTVTIPPAERDPELLERLKSQWSGILAWAVEGCLAWQREGLNPPRAVRSATVEYLENEDTVGRWLSERAVLGPQYFASSTALYEDWKKWCEASGEFVGSQRLFSQKLEQHAQLEKRRTELTRGFMGIALKSDATRRHPG